MYVSLVETGAGFISVEEQLTSEKGGRINDDRHSPAIQQNAGAPAWPAGKSRPLG